MRKQRVLALLLAFSLAVSTNGMTVLAAGPDLSGISATVEDNGSSIAEGTTDAPTSEGETAPDGSENGGQTTEDEADASAGENQNGQENPGDDQQNPDASAGNDQNGEENPGASTGEDQNDPENPSGSEEEKPSDEEELNSDDTEEDGDLSGEDGEAAEEETEEEPDEKEKKPAAVQSLAPRMMSFKDEVGMLVTYNVNDKYEYTVDENGTLTAISKVGGGAIAGSVVLEEGRGIKRIASGVFAGNTEITYIKLPAGVETIGTNAFKGCTALKGMTIPTGVTAIEESAFEGCSALTQFALPATIESIGDRAFFGDTRLFMVYMKSIDSSALSSIGNSAFRGCTALIEFCSDTEFTFPNSLTSIGEYAFYNCRAVKSIVFSENISTMGSNVFASCGSLEKVVLPRALTAIPQYAFADCSSLMAVEFVDDNETATVGSYAFKGCYRLGSIELRLVNLIEMNAFIGCDGLVRVSILHPTCDIKDDAFPDVDTLYLIGSKGSTAERYAKNRKINFIDMLATTDTGLYKYKIVTSGDGSGTVSLSILDEEGKDTKKDPNAENNNQGVKAGTKILVTTTIHNGSQLSGMTCNGTQIVANKLNQYIFEMPKGGALLIVEFENTGGSTSIKGTEVEYEFSNGSNGDGSATLKIGQTTRLFLIDVEGNVVPASKVTFSSDNPTIVTVTKTGMVTALKEGLAHISMEVTGGNGKITTRATVNVVKTDVVSLKLTASSYDKDIFRISEQASGDQMVQVAYMENTNAVRDKSVTLVLKALAYDADMDDPMSVALKWSSSDSTVAKLASTSTANAAAVNTITIPKGASGEATITVSATNADKKTISQKFIIQVRDNTPRLSTTSLTINPNKENGAVLRVITAYGGAINPETFKLVESQDDTQEADFQGVYDRESSSDTVHYFTITPKFASVREGTYTVKVSLDSKPNPTPVKITVKSSLPNPKVAFDKKQPKINLFYANDGTEVKPVVTNLGNEKVSRYKLEPLSTNQDNDDWLFTENFQIDEETGIITQKEDQMFLSKLNKPVVTGNLVLYFEGYKESAAKKYKITIPTQTVKPSYKLDRTSDVYSLFRAKRTIKLTLIDTKSKNKEPVILDDSNWDIDMTAESNVDAVNSDIVINEQGQIEMHTDDDRALEPGKVVLSVRNNEWAEGQSFKYTYTIKATAAAPKIKLQTATVNLNSNYAGQVEKFYLTSNQCDTELADSQDFYFQSTTTNKDQEEYLHVNYSDGVGTVSVDPDVKAGTYKFKCDSVEGVNAGEHYNAVTLTVKVVNTLPSMTVKGAPALNLLAEQDGEYTEIAELKLNAKLPEGYEIDASGTIDSIECTTKGTSEDFIECFDWDIEDNTLLIKLRERVNPQKYTFTMKPVYSGVNAFQGKAVKFSVKVYTGSISVKLSPKGALNLVDRQGEYTLKNSIVYTPSFTNLKDTVVEVRIFDADGSRPDPDGEESKYFSAEVLDGKIYVSPRDGADLENKKSYPVKIWVRLENYYGYAGKMLQDVYNIKTAQVLPKVTADRSDLNLYMSNKVYEATFRVTPKEGSVGNIADVVFGEKDTKSQDSFEIRCGEPRADGSIDVHVKLKNTVSFAGGSTNKITMYVMFDGQGVNTVGPAITMNVKINK